MEVRKLKVGEDLNSEVTAKDGASHAPFVVGPKDE
jgi:hypothetical protein